LGDVDFTDSKVKKLQLFGNYDIAGNVTHLFKASNDIKFIGPKVS
jgi:hypothetical protein